MFAHRQIVFQTLLVNAAKRAQKVAGCRPQSFDSVDRHLSHSISIVISRPLFLAVTNRAVGSIDSGVALPFIGITSGLLLCVPMHVLLQRLAIGMVAHAQATVPTLPAHRPDDWRPSIFLRAVATPLVGSAPRRIKRIAVFVPFFPPRSETSHRFQSPHRATPSGLTAHTRWLGFFCASDGRTGVRATVPRLRRSPVHPYKHRAITTPRAGAQGCCRQRGFQYRGYRCFGIFGSGNRQSHSCACETLAPVESSHRSQDISVLWGESISPPPRGFVGHRVIRLLGRSFPDFNMHKLVT